MRQKHALLACATLLLAAALLPTLLLLFHEHPSHVAASSPARRVEVRVGLEPTLNGTRNVIVEYVAPHGTGAARVLFEDPSQANESYVGETNTTSGEARIPLSSLPQLFRVRVFASEPDFGVHVRWCWSGRAHFVCAETPGELARALKGDS